MTSGRKAIMPSSRCPSSTSITMQQETHVPDFMAPITWLRVQRSFAAVVVRTVTSEEYHCSVLTGVFPRLVTRMVHECVTNVATDEVGWRPTSLSGYFAKIRLTAAKTQSDMISVLYPCSGRQCVYTRCAGALMRGLATCKTLTSWKTLVFSCQNMQRLQISAIRGSSVKSFAIAILPSSSGAINIAFLMTGGSVTSSALEDTVGVRVF